MDIHSVKALQYSGPEILPDWNLYKALVEEGLSHSLGEATSEDLLKAIAAGRSQLFAVIDLSGAKAVMITSLLQHPQYKTVFIETLAGKNAIQYCSLFWNSFTTWARENNAVAIEGACRPSVTRLLRRLGLRKVYDVVRVSLEENHVWN